MGPSGERAIGGVTSGVMKLDDSVTWRARHFGLPFTMSTRITEYEAPLRFVDEQTSGPFRRWRHEHRFDATGDGAGPVNTVMTDTVEFDSPAGPLGRMVNRLFLTRYMRNLFIQRNQWLETTLNSKALEGRDS